MAITNKFFWDFLPPIRHVVVSVVIKEIRGGDRQSLSEAIHNSQILECEEGIGTNKDSAEAEPDTRVNDNCNGIVKTLDCEV